MIAFLTPLLTALGPLSLVLLMGILFVETGLLVGSFLPGDTLLFAAGVLVAAHALPLSMWVLVPACAAAAVVGDQVGYLLGRRYGARIFSSTREGLMGRLLSREHAERVERFFQAHGGRAIVLARFVPVVRGLTPAAAGLAGMPRRRFTFFNVLGGTTWAAGALLAGYFTGGISLVAQHVELLALAVAVVGALPVVLTWWRGRVLQRRTAVTEEPRASEAVVA